MTDGLLGIPIVYDEDCPPNVMYLMGPTRSTLELGDWWAVWYRIVEPQPCPWKANKHFGYGR